MALSRVLSPTMVGRDDELSRLEDALLSALRGDGGVVIVGGEAGMGKTRLVNSLSTRARKLDCTVISGACSEAELALPYLPFLEAIGNHLVTVDLAALRGRLGAAADELANLFPQMGRPTLAGGEPVQAKLRLFESMLLLMRDAARPRALLVILEDLQWADPATRELLDYSTRRLRATNVLIVATYRSDEMHRKHALLPTIQGWRRNGQVEMVELKPLDIEGVGEMVCAIFEETSVSDEFRNFLHVRSEGNPFVVEEMLRDALDRGDIFRSETGWDRKRLEEMRMPATVRDTLLQRVERLNHDHAGVLSAASVIGRSFDLSTLADVVGGDGSAVMAALEASVTAQLLEEEDRSTDHFRFRHALTREAVYEDLVVPRRQQLHSRVADVLAARTVHVPIDVANHLLMAGRYDEAVAMCKTAADDAARGHAYRAAAELLERAAQHVPDTADRARMLCEAGAHYLNNSETAQARRLLEPGVADLEAAGFELEAAAYRLLLGRCWWELMRSDLALSHYEQALKVLEPAGPSEALALALIRLSGMAAFANDREPALEYATRAVAVADQVGSSFAKAWAWNFMGLAEIHRGDVAAGFSHLEDSYAVAVASDHRFQVGNAVYNAFWTSLHLAEAEELKKWSARIDTVRFSDVESWPPYLIATRMLFRGDVSAAIPIAQLALQRARDAGHGKQVWRSSVVLGHALAESMQSAESAAVMPPVSSRVEVQDAVYHSLGLIHHDLARGNAEDAVAHARIVPLNACYLAAPVDVVAEVITDAAWLRAFIDALPIPGELARSPRLTAARGRLALLEGRFEEARDLLRQADEGLRQGGLLLDAWHLGRALAEAQSGTGDEDAARRTLADIVAEADPKGALLAAKLAREVASRLGLDIGEPRTAPPVATLPVATGERLVSVLFADVRGFTRMTAENAPAEIAERISSLQRWAGREVERRHGMVDKFAGDAIMATFNVAGQSVDHAVQALRAAIAIIDKAALAGLPVGAGVAVGPAVVGSLAESANVSVLGEVTNLASRLQGQAGAGEILLSEEAFRRCRDWLEAQRISAEKAEIDLKGFSGPVGAVRVRTGLAAPV